jgi:hypothetical protein
MRRPAGLPQSSLTQVLVNGAAEQSQVVAEQAQVCHTPSALQLHLTHRRFLRWRRASGQVWMDVVNNGQGSGEEERRSSQCWRLLRTAVASPRVRLRLSCSCWRVRQPGPRARAVVSLPRFVSSIGWNISVPSENRPVNSAPPAAFHSNAPSWTETGLAIVRRWKRGSPKLCALTTQTDVLPSWDGEDAAELYHRAQRL